MQGLIVVFETCRLESDDNYDVIDVAMSQIIHNAGSQILGFFWNNS